MEATIYTTKGKEAGKVTLNEKVWGLPWNADLVYQVVESMRANARAGTAHAKDRGAVSGGGKKPWQQKGTGRARHGSSRSPIWRHGGVTHGPLAAKDYSKKINKKVRIKALHLILSEKLRKHEVMFLDDISMKEPKTRDAKVILAALAGVKGFEKLLTKKRNAAYIAASGNKEVAAKSFSNFGNVNFDDVKNMNPLDLLSHKYVVFAGTAEGVKFVEDKLTK
ncbi:MAG: 50S ribosomal protein L4 [Parcubacteria group bacterium GW2011_GWA1_47_8]|nr:MAG: 50S ribosomal protein L4 [Parcubacteria group bacterium GW2011_GWA1_47_8]KKW07864.1 MAG: 50S ribosomal protein L4 [Parcubacteria group bacterium GW2011_GWA2_49_16]